MNFKEVPFVSLSNLDLLRVVKLVPFQDSSLSMIVEEKHI